MEAWLRVLSSKLVDHRASVDSVRDFFRQNMDCDLDFYLRVMSTAVNDPTANFRSQTPSIVEKHRATLRQAVACILTHIDDRLAALVSEPLVTTSCDPSGPDEAPPPSSHVI